MPPPPEHDEVPIPALLRAARGAYAHAVRSRVEAAGFDDLPRNGAYVLGGMANRGGSAGDVIRQLGVTKQAASQLVDTLVVRGHLERRVNEDDRRRTTLELTDRGRATASAVRQGVDSVDAELARLLSSAERTGLRAGLEALCEIRERLER
jgi:DNA-binding MarR family transcriptional regulator